MLRRVLTFSLLLVMLACGPGFTQAVNTWLQHVCPVAMGQGGGIHVGTSPASRPGWDGSPPLPPLTEAGVYVSFFHQHGPDWSGPTGFYFWDTEPPIPLGGSHTWRNIYLWAQDYTPPDGVARMRHTPLYYLPHGYTGKLVLDYVPAELGWAGPMEIWLDMAAVEWFDLPVPTVEDPLQGVRMHLTVYAVPEPSSLLALFAGLAGVGGMAFRRRRR